MKKLIQAFASRFSERARAKRGEIFVRYLRPSEKDKILDLGSGMGAHLASIIPFRSNVTIADIHEEQLLKGQKKFGFQTVLLDETDKLPFPDKFFDIVFCSSVIEHVTVPKSKMRTFRNNREFQNTAFKRQRAFAEEIRRVGKRYFVQTPYKFFPIESHSWLPVFVVFLPRSWQISIVDFLAGWWPKSTTPDWNLLTSSDLEELFPDALIVSEKVGIFTKSIMAIKS